MEILSKGKNGWDVDNREGIRKQSSISTSRHPGYIDRIPSNESPNRPVQSLKEIKEELKTDDFGIIFREFSKREAIYGFGDLQVKRLLDELPE